MLEAGIELIDKDTELQIRCPWHGPDNTPSARYYAGQDPHFHCFTCKLHMRGIDIFGKLHNLKFMGALSELERRFNIKVPRRPETDIEAPEDRNGQYQSKAWDDIPRVMDMLEAKLLRLRNSVPMTDYIKWCRILDAIRWDLDHNGGQPLPQMSIALSKLRNMMGGVKQDVYV
jgi:DNA primase